MISDYLTEQEKDDALDWAARQERKAIQAESRRSEREREKAAPPQEQPVGDPPVVEKSVHPGFSRNVMSLINSTSTNESYHSLSAISAIFRLFRC